MTINNVLVNDRVKLKIKFFDQDSNGNQIEANVVSVVVRIVNSDEIPVIDDELAVQVTSSDWYYEFTPALPGAYAVSFTGTTVANRSIVSRMNIYANTSTTEYKPTVTLRSDETIVFAPDVSPLYLDPEELAPIFPEASLIEIGEIVYNHSLEIQEMYHFDGTEDPGTFPYIILDYVKAASACDLSRTYGFGGDDELSLKLGDLEIVNRSAPRQIATRSNATTWCQIAASLRREVIARKVNMKGVLPKGLPKRKVTLTERDPGTGKRIYLISKDMYSVGRAYVAQDDTTNDRRLRQYD
jgi:hypothetical protein